MEVVEGVRVYVVPEGGAAVWVALKRYVPAVASEGPTERK
jgi:hypothetical protein